MIRFALAALLPVAAVAQTTAPATAPVEHRLTPDEIAAAQADGESRNRAAELLAMTRGEAALTLPAERKKPQIHGEAGFGIDSRGGREVFGAATTTLDNGTSLSVAGDYIQYGRGRRPY